MKRGVGDGHLFLHSYDADGLLTDAGAFAVTRDPQNGLPTAVNGTTGLDRRTGVIIRGARAA